MTLTTLNLLLADEIRASHLRAARDSRKAPSTALRVSRRRREALRLFRAPAESPCAAC